MTDETDAPNGSADDDPPVRSAAPTEDTPDDLDERMRRAIAQVRREGYKAAAVYAVVDGVALAMLVALVLALLDPAALDRVEYGDALAPAAVGVLAAAGEFAWRIGRPLVERFEAVNPEVEEALRTARDTLDSGRSADSAMARALYADVLDRLGRASSAGLLDLRRIAGTLVVVLVLSGAAVQVTVVGVEVGPRPAPDSATPTPTPAGGGASGGGGGSAGYEGLEDGDQVLGDDADVDAGTRNLTANVSGSSGGQRGEDARYDAGGYGGAGGIEAARAGYAGQERVEDADLIREYNLRIRDNEE